MRALDYALRQGWTSLWRGGASSGFASAAIALALIVLGAILLVTWNVERLLSEWASAAEFSVYLDDRATSEERGVVEALVDASGVAAGREYVSKAEALARFRREFTDLASLTAGFDDNPFPASVEVRIDPDAERDGRAAALVPRVAALPGVVDVRYDGEWLTTVNAGLQGIRRAGLALALLMGLAAAATVAAVVSLGLYARRDELEIMELVGAPFTFIRGPFVAEGVLLGGLGAAAALALLWVGFAALVAAWGPGLTALLDGGSMEFLPARFSVALLAGGMLVGGTGGLAASRRLGAARAVPPPGAAVDRASAR